MKYKPGQRLVLKNFYVEKYIGTTVTILKIVTNLYEEYYSIEMFDRKIYDTSETNLLTEEEYADYRYANKCTCGSEYTSNKKFHYDWCSLYSNKKKDI